MRTVIRNTANDIVKDRYRSVTVLPLWERKRPVKNHWRDRVQSHQCQVIVCRPGEALYSVYSILTSCHVVSGLNTAQNSLGILLSQLRRDVDADTMLIPRCQDIIDPIRERRQDAEKLCVQWEIQYRKLEEEPLCTGKPNTGQKKEVWKWWVLGSPILWKW